MPKESLLVVNGEVHRLYLLPSSLHWKVERASSERNRKVGVRSVVRWGGRLLIVVWGGSLSPPPPPPPQAVSVGGVEFGRGVRGVGEKSALLSLVSSAASSRVGHPAAIERVIDIPAGIAASLVPTGNGRSAWVPALLKLP